MNNNISIKNNHSFLDSKTNYCVLSTQKLLEETNQLINEKNKKYYYDVIDFLGLLFDTKCKQLVKIKLNKITLNEDIFKFYNEIINHYKINKPLFDIEKFNLEKIIEDLEPDKTKILFQQIAIKLSNELLEKINYKIYINKTTNKLYLKYLN